VSPADRIVLLDASLGTSDGRQAGPHVGASALSDQTDSEVRGGYS
jgi:hypothetical protein